jgi:hypothetical protein
VPEKFFLHGEMFSYRSVLLLVALLSIGCDVATAIEAKCSACNLVAVSGEFAPAFTHTLHEPLYT